MRGSNYPAAEQNAEVVREIIKNSPTNQTRIARRLGIAQATVAQRVSCIDSTSTANLNVLMDICGYEVVLMPKGEKLPRNSYALAVKSYDTDDEVAQVKTDTAKKDKEKDSDKTESDEDMKREILDAVAAMLADFKKEL